MNTWVNGESSHVLTLENVNDNLVRMEYAVRGPIPARAVELIKELKENKPKPFEEVIRANIGDSHMMGEKPITFFRQVLSASLFPKFSLEDPKLPSDVKERVKLLLSYCGGHSVGSYSDSAGIEIIRRHVSEYIEERDGFPSDWHNIILTSGASEGVKLIFQLINSKSQYDVPTGVMVPIPQYPLYSATCSELGMHLISYYLNEDKEWALDIDELQRALDESKKRCSPKAIVVINPGNPTGSVLTQENIADVIRFARNNDLIIIADEVYQHNIWKEGARFHSFKKVMHQIGIKLELVSLMSASKGYMGECGLRGGYMEIENFDPGVQAILMKQISARLCSTLIGQIAIDCVVKPPKVGEPSYDLFEKEREQVLCSLKERAELTFQTFNSLPRIQLNPVAGAMYAFPKIDLPPKAILEAEKLGQKPDFFYCKQLLEQTGICLVPGSGFGQIPETHHFRTTILPQPDLFRRMMSKFKQFHLKFLQQYE